MPWVRKLRYQGRVIQLNVGFGALGKKTTLSGKSNTIKCRIWCPG